MSTSLGARPDRAAIDSAAIDSTAIDSTAIDVVSPRAFKDLFRHHPAGVAIVTVNAADGSPVGFTATSVISVSADPPILAFSVTQTSSSWDALSAAASGVVHFLGTGHEDLSTRFATPGIDRFAGVSWDRLPSGEPWLTEVDTWARFEILDRIRAGSSHLVLATVTDISEPGSVPEQPTRLVYVDRTYRRLHDV